MTDASAGWPGNPWVGHPADDSIEMLARIVDPEAFGLPSWVPSGGWDYLTDRDEARDKAAAILALAPFLAAALAAQAGAMREACAAIVDAHAAAAKRCSEEGDVIYRIRAEFLANSYAITQAADDVRVTPIPHADALAAALTEARKAGLREAAGVAKEHADVWRHTNAQAANGGRCIAAAILALAEEATDD